MKNKVVVIGSLNIDTIQMIDRLQTKEKPSPLTIKQVHLVVKVPIRQLQLLVKELM